MQLDSTTLLHLGDLNPFGSIKNPTRVSRTKYHLFPNKNPLPSSLILTLTYPALAGKSFQSLGKHQPHLK